MAIDITRTREYRELKQAILDNLEARGLVEPVYTDKAQEYMDLWERLRLLKLDIKARGITVMDEKRGMEVENRSVSLGLQTSRQMLAIFAALGFQDEAKFRKMAQADSPDDEL